MCILDSLTMILKDFFSKGGTLKIFQQLFLSFLFSHFLLCFPYNLVIDSTFSEILFLVT